jgi:hypothetical protein
MRRFTWMLGAILSWSILLGHCRAEEVARLLNKPFVEQVNKRQRVGGSDIQGLIAIPKAGLKTPQSLFVWLPPKLQQSVVCVQIAQRDGAYTAYNSFELPSVGAGTVVRIPIETAYPEFYQRATEKNFGTVARLGKCPAEDGELLILSWGNFPASERKTELALTVQSADREVQMSLSEDPKSDKIKCERIEEGLGTVFDTICKIPASFWNDVRTPIRIERCAYNQCLKMPSSWVLK